MDEIVRSRLAPVRARQRFVQIARCSAWGLLAGGIAALSLSLLLYFKPDAAAPWAPFVLAAVGVALGALVGLAIPRAWRDAAAAVDRHYSLKDRAATALELIDRRETSAACQLAINDAVAHLGQVVPREVAPFRIPRVLPYAVAPVLAACLFVALSIMNRPVAAEPPAPLAVVVEQADRMTSELEELEQFVEEEKDPEIEQLLRELKEKLDEMKQPGVDTREALSKLSEMQAMLESQQAKYNVGAVDSQLQSVGEALALADPLADAGAALSNGQYEKAAEMLEKMEMPKLDRQTEKAVKEKLNEAARRMSEAGADSLGEAAGQMANGLGEDGGQFREGSNKLANESRRQARRKRLHDLLQKQCNCLSECKGECEGECKGSRSNKSGKSNNPSNKWGLAASGGELGEQTPALGGKKIEKIKGQYSDEGEVEVETTTTPEATQQASREYRQNYAKYKKLSDAVLESEAIPLGHRQTIRRYFESIRPDDEELDRVDAAIDQQ